MQSVIKNKTYRKFKYPVYEYSCILQRSLGVYQTPCNYVNIRGLIPNDKILLSSTDFRSGDLRTVQGTVEPQSAKCGPYT